MNDYIYLELFKTLLEDFNYPIYININDKFYLYYNDIKEVMVSDEFLTLYKSKKHIFTGIFEGKTVHFYCIRFFISNDILAFIIPYEKTNDYINVILTAIFNNFVKYYKKTAEDINMLKQELDINRQKITELEEKNSKIYKAFQNLSEEKIKLENIVNGQATSLFVVDFNFNIVYANDSFVKYLLLKDYDEVLNKKCFNVIYNFDEPCKWCKIQDVINLQKQMNQHINAKVNNSEFVFDQVMYPVILNGEVKEVVEILSDITEYMQLLTSIEKIDKEKRLIAKKNVDNIKEIGSLKQAYDELYTEYVNTRGQLDKLETLVVKLIEFDNVRKVLDALTQLKEINSRNKILESRLENYEKKIKTYEEKIEELSGKAVYSINRLINIIKNRKELSKEEIENMLTYIEKQINMLKKEEDYGN